MKTKKNYLKKFRLCYIEAAVISIIACAFLFPSLELFRHTGDNYFTVRLNGVEAGCVGSMDKLDKLMGDARKSVSVENGADDLLFMELSLETSGREVIFGAVDSDETVTERLADIMRSSVQETLQRAYTVKINDTTVNLSSHEEVHDLLKQALAPYDTEGKYDVELLLDDDREMNVLEACVVEPNAESDEEETPQAAGVEAVLTAMFSDVEPAAEKSFDDYALGLIGIGYAETIEVSEAYLMKSELQNVSEAVDRVTKEQETQVIYEVKAGDTLSQISLDSNIPMNEIVAMNDALEDENTTIRVGQELVLTVPEPDLSIVWEEEQVYVEDYEAEVQYVPNDAWYTTQSETLQAPSAGRRKVAALIRHKNNSELGREIIKEEIYAEAVPKIVERGTKIPPTYIKPISGGRLSSGFGARSAPTKGASTYHKGIDWATPVGTTVVASNAGTVVTAGWASGYGYAVYINHDDGKQTRYGHLSKVLVKPGQRVAQGERIALSGNTGITTGPHVHFEIRINGNAVNPLNYLN